MSSPGPIKYNADNVLYLSDHNSFPHSVHESLVVECSLMEVLLYGYHCSLCIHELALIEVLL